MFGAVVLLESSMLLRKHSWKKKGSPVAMNYPGKKFGKTYSKAAVSPIIC